MYAVTQEQQRQQSEMQALLDDIAHLKEDQDILFEETGVSHKISGVAMWNRIVGLENECDHFTEVTGRLEKYLEEMLRKMLGTLDQGRCIPMYLPFALLCKIHCREWQHH